MYIFIDESGTFVVPTPAKHAVSCVAALVVPDSLMGDVTAAFRAWKKRHGHNPDNEVKGSALNEPEIADLIGVLPRYPVLLQVYGVDMGVHTVAEISARKEEQACAMTASLTPEHDPGFVRAAENYAAKIRAMPNQLFAQMVLNLELVNGVLDIAPTFYGMRMPPELGVFHWVVDAKENQVTAYEDAWRTLTPPSLTDRSLKGPRQMLPGVDYSHMKRRYSIPFDQIPEGYRNRIKNRRPSDTFDDVGRIVWEDFRFGVSDTEPGLQLADILANAIRRALNGKLQQSGWGEIGRLFVDEKDGFPGVRMCLIRPGPAANEVQTVPYAPVLHAVAAKAQPLPTPAYLKWLHSGRPDPYAPKVIAGDTMDNDS